MAMSKCSECKGNVSDQAWMCPHCGLVRGNEVKEFLEWRKAAPSSGAPGGEEKRRHRRVDIKTMVRVDGETAMLFNISKSGMKLSSPFTPKAGSVDITLDNGQQTFVMKGEVRWVSGKRSFSNLIDFGVEISQASPEYYEFVEVLLASF